MTDNYYAKNLNSSSLVEVYATDLPLVARYLRAEIDFIRQNLKPSDRVLELGTGYGRVLKELSPHAETFVGVDIAEGSIALGRELTRDCPNLCFLIMDAHNLNLDSEFDVVLCLQNGLSALKGDPLNLVRQMLKPLAENGTAYLSTYSPKFWESRLAWFAEQADKGLLGPIDPEKTKDGCIVCQDGFTALTFSQDELEELGRASGYPYEIKEVDDSSLFLIISKKQ